MVYMSCIVIAILNQLLEEISQSFFYCTHLLWNRLPTGFREIIGASKFKEAGGGVFMNLFSEIDFFVVFNRGDRYLSDAFGPMKKYCS